MSANVETYNDHEEALLRAGVFHPDDLAWNLAGELAPAQKRWLILEAAFWLVLAGLELGMALLLWWFYFQFHGQTLLFISLFWSVFLAFCAGVCIMNAKPVVEEIRDSRVDEIAGIVSKHGTTYSVTGKPLGMGCSLEIHNHSFPISSSTYYVIDDHRSYRLFYTPRNRTLVNIEPL